MVNGVGSGVPYVLLASFVVQVAFFLFTAWPPDNEPLLSVNDPVWVNEAETG